MVRVASGYRIGRTIRRLTIQCSFEFWIVDPVFCSVRIYTGLIGNALVEIIDLKCFTPLAGHSDE